MLAWEGELENTTITIWEEKTGHELKAHSKQKWEPMRNPEIHIVFHGTQQTDYTRKKAMKLS